MRLRIMDPDGHTVVDRAREDDWYAVGGHRRPELRQDERDHTAATELREWLARTAQPPGTYTVLVVELDPVSKAATGQTWASVKVNHRIRTGVTDS